MLYIKIDKDFNILDRTPLTLEQLKKKLTGVSFPVRIDDNLPSEFLNFISYARLLPVDGDINQILKQTSKMRIVISDFILNQKGEFERLHELQEVSDDEAIKRYDRKMLEIRAKRDKLLKETDFSQTLDSKKYELFKNYREILRNLPNQGIDPYQIVFPEYPNENNLSQEQVIQSIQNFIDSKAAEKGYDNINSISKYLVEGNEYYDECKALSLWCGNCWKKLNEINSDIAEGILDTPDSVDYFISQMPQLPQL